MQNRPPAGPDTGSVKTSTRPDDHRTGLHWTPILENGTRPDRTRIVLLENQHRTGQTGSGGIRGPARTPSRTGLPISVQGANRHRTGPAGPVTTPVEICACLPHKIGVITLGTFTTTTRGLVPCRQKSFPKVSREEQPLKIVPEAALVPKNYFFIKLEPGFESSDAFLIPPGEPYSTL